MRSFIALVLVALGGRGALPALAGPPDELDRALEILDALEVSRVNIEPALHELAGALDALEQFAPVPLEADWEALDRLAIDVDEQVLLEAKNASLADVLAAVMFQLGDEFEHPTYDVHAGRIVITTQAGTGPLRLTGVYDVRDLLARGDTEALLGGRVASETAAPDAGEGAAPAGDAASGIAPREPTAAEDLMTFIAAHVDPDAWLEYGGSRAKMTARDGVVLVSATARTHRMFRRVLEHLRRVHPAALHFEATIVDVPRATLTAHERRYDAGSAALARALRRDGAALWRSDVVVALGQTAEVTATAADRSFTLGLAPRQEQQTGRVTVAIDAELQTPDGRSSVRTVAAVPLLHGGIVLELSGAAPGDAARLLVLLPSRE